jgi:hypothetical protein
MTAPEEIQKPGSVLHFTIRRDTDGWSAQCSEVPGIIAGSRSINLDGSEIETQIRDAIHTAFHVTHLPIKFTQL